MYFHKNVASVKVTHFLGSREPESNSSEGVQKVNVKNQRPPIIEHISYCLFCKYFAFFIMDYLMPVKSQEPVVL